MIVHEVCSRCSRRAHFSQPTRCYSMAPRRQIHWRGVEEVFHHGIDPLGGEHQLLLSELPAPLRFTSVITLSFSSAAAPGHCQNESLIIREVIEVVVMLTLSARDSCTGLMIRYVGWQTLRSHFVPSSLRRADIDFLTVVVAESDAVHIFCGSL